MEKTLKITFPKGYKIDKDKSIENIVSEKVDDVVIEWNKEYKSVEIKADDEHFMLDASKPSYYCSWNDAIRFHERGMWKLPTVKQLQVLAKYIDKVNEVIRNNYGYEIIGWLWSHEEKDEFHAWSVWMDDGGIYGGSKSSLTYVRGVSVL